MKIKVTQQELLPIIQSVSRACGIRSTLPVLANVLLSASGDILTLSATNLEIGVIRQLPAQVEEEGAITLPARTLVEIISSLSSGPIDLEASSDQLKISNPHFSATLNGISANEFPSIPLSSEQSITIESQALSESLPEISFAAAADDGRPILTGILTQIKKDTLELVATDGFRLAHKTTKVKEEGEDFKSLIPKRTLEEVARLISEEKNVKEVEISTSENQNQVIFKIGSTQLSSRLIEGQYPSWEKIIPSTFENTCTVDRSELLKAIKLASVFAKDNANIVKIETQDSSLKITSEAKELGEQETSVACQSTGTPLTIAFNSKFLIDALNASPDSKVKVEFSGSMSAALIKPLSESGVEYVVMPVRLS